MHRGEHRGRREAEPHLVLRVDAWPESPGRRKWWLNWEERIRPCSSSPAHTLIP